MKPIDVLLTKNGHLWSGEFNLLPMSVSFILTFQDDKGIPDINDGNGYVFYIRDDAGNVPNGARSTIAQHMVRYSDLFNIEVDMKRARSIFEEEFEEDD